MQDKSNATKKAFDISRLSSKPIFCPELSKEWPSARAAARDLGLTARLIRACANFERDNYSDLNGTPLTFVWCSPQTDAIRKQHSRFPFAYAEKIVDDGLLTYLDIILTEEFQGFPKNTRFDWAEYSPSERYLDIYSDNCDDVSISVELT